MKGYRAVLIILTAIAPLFAGASGHAAALPGLKSAVADKASSNVERIAKRCRYDRRGRLRCRSVRSRAYPRGYYYDPYADYGYYPRYYGYGHHHHHFRHHGYGHGHHHGHH